MLNTSWGETAYYAGFAGVMLAGIVNVTQFWPTGDMGRVPSALEASMASHIVGVAHGIHENPNILRLNNITAPIDVTPEQEIIYDRMTAVHQRLVDRTVLDDSLSLIYEQAKKDTLDNLFTFKDFTDMRSSMKYTVETLDTVARDVNSAVAEVLTEDGSAEHLEATLSHAFNVSVQDVSIKALELPEDIYADMALGDCEITEPQDSVGFSETWIREHITDPLTQISETTILPDASASLVSEDSVFAIYEIVVDGSTRGPVCDDSPSPSTSPP